MPLLNGRINATRLIVEDTLPSGWREIYRDRIEAQAFRGPVYPEVGVWMGWCHINDEAKTDFSDFNAWLMTNYIALGLRFDTYSIPAKALRMRLNVLKDEWMEDRGIERCPRAVVQELKEMAQTELIRKVLPKTKSVELIWDLQNNTAYASTHSSTDLDHLRRVFFRTFGRRLMVFYPSGWIIDTEQREAIVTSTPLYLEKTG